MTPLFDFIAVLSTPFLGGIGMLIIIVVIFRMALKSIGDQN